MEAPANCTRDYDLSVHRLNDLMKDYLAIKKVERENVIENMHPEVRKRIYAIKKLQLQTIYLDADFHREMYNLEQKFQPKQAEIYKKRSEIISGTYEPNEEECKLEGVEMNLDGPIEGQEKPSGVPQFWLTIMKNVSELRTMMREGDEDVLKHLVDVRAFSKPPPDMSFQLEFHFEPNEFFQNSVLTKTYLMKCCPDEMDPFMYEGPEIYKSIGCEILWNAGKNVIEADGKAPSSLPFFKFDSFFNFFNPPEMIPGPPEESEKIETYLENDFEVGHYIKERVIPRAVLFFTGEIDEDISDDESLGIDEDVINEEVVTSTDD